MRTILLVTLCLLPALIHAADEKKDMTNLVGTWNVLSMDNGKGAKETKGLQLLITAKDLTLRGPTGATKKMGDIARTDSATKPAQLDLKNGADTGLGIYEVTGDTAKLIIGDPGQDRPKEFKGAPTGILFLLQRAAK